MRLIKNEKGFTLIEVVIALLLLGIIASGFLMALSGATKAIIVADKRTTAESLARSQMEYVKDQGYITAPDYNPGPPSGGEVIYLKITEISGYTIWSEDRGGATVSDIIGVPWDSQTNQPVDIIDVGLQRIKLVIKYYGNEVLTLEGYKVDR